MGLARPCGRDGTETRFPRCRSEASSTTAHHLQCPLGTETKPTFQQHSPQVGLSLPPAPWEMLRHPGLALAHQIPPLLSASLSGEEKA